MTDTTIRRDCPPFVPYLRLRVVAEQYRTSLRANDNDEAPSYRGSDGIRRRINSDYYVVAEFSDGQSFAGPTRFGTRTQADAIVKYLRNLNYFFDPKDAEKFNWKPYTSLPSETLHEELQRRGYHRQWIGDNKD